MDKNRSTIADTFSQGASSEVPAYGRVMVKSPNANPTRLMDAFWLDWNNTKVHSAQWRLQEAGDKTWPEKIVEDEDEVGSSEQKKSERRVCCCDQVTEIKIFITVFAIINLGIMAAGGVGFGLGLNLNTNGEDTFKYLMVMPDLLGFSETL